MRYRVLIASPNPLYLAANRVFLAPEGVEVVPARDWGECQEALLRDRPDLLILDPEALAGLSDDLVQVVEPVKNTPVLILTAHPDLWAEKVGPLSNYGLLLKPVCPARMADIVHAFLEQEQAGRELLL